MPFSTSEAGDVTLVILKVPSSCTLVKTALLWAVITSTSWPGIYISSFPATLCVLQIFPSHFSKLRIHTISLSKSIKSDWLSAADLDKVSVQFSVYLSIQSSWETKSNIMLHQGIFGDHEELLSHLAVTTLVLGLGPFGSFEKRKLCFPAAYPQLHLWLYYATDTDVCWMWTFRDMMLHTK